MHLFIIYSCLKLVVEPTEEKTNNVTKVKFHDPPARRTGAMFDAEKVWVKFLALQKLEELVQQHCGWDTGMFFATKHHYRSDSKNTATLQWRSKSSLRHVFCPRCLVLKVFRIIWPTKNRCAFFYEWDVKKCSNQRLKNPIEKHAVRQNDTGSSFPSFDVIINTLKAPHTNTKYQQFLKISNFFLHFLKPVWKHVGSPFPNVTPE